MSITHQSTYMTRDKRQVGNGHLLRREYGLDILRILVFKDYSESCLHISSLVKIGKCHELGVYSIKDLSSLEVFRCIRAWIAASTSNMDSASQRYRLIPALSLSWFVRNICQQHYVCRFSSSPHIVVTSSRKCRFCSTSVDVSLSRIWRT